MSPLRRDDGHPVPVIPSMGVRAPNFYDWSDTAPFLYEDNENLPSGHLYPFLGDEGLSPRTNSGPVSLPVAQAGPLVSQPPLAQPALTTPPPQSAAPASFQPTSTSCADITPTQHDGTRPRGEAWCASCAPHKVGAARSSPDAGASVSSFPAPRSYFLEPHHSMELAQGRHPVSAPPFTAQAPGPSEILVRASTPHDPDPPTRRRLAQPIQLAFTQQQDHALQQHDVAQSHNTSQRELTDVERQTVTFGIIYEGGEQPLKLIVRSQDRSKGPLLVLEPMNPTAVTHSSELGRVPSRKAFEPQTQAILSVEPGQQIIVRMSKDSLVGMAGDYLHQARKRSASHSPIPHPRSAKTRRAASDDAELDPTTDFDTPAGNEANQKDKGEERRGRDGDRMRNLRKHERKEGRQRGSSGMNGVPRIPSFEALRTADKKPRFPFDFAACDYDEGIKELLNLQRQKINQRDSFSRVFHGATYTKSTVHKYRKIWEQSPKELRQEFIGYGHSDKGLFANFVAALKEQKNKEERLDLGESDSESESDEQGDGNRTVHQQLEAPEDLEIRGPNPLLQAPLGGLPQSVMAMPTWPPEYPLGVPGPSHANDDRSVHSAALAPFPSCEPVYEYESHDDVFNF